MLSSLLSSTTNKLYEGSLANAPPWSRFILSANPSATDCYEVHHQTHSLTNWYPSSSFSAPQVHCLLPLVLQKVQHLWQHASHDGEIRRQLGGLSGREDGPADWGEEKDRGTAPWNAATVSNCWWKSQSSNSGKIRGNSAPAWRQLSRASFVEVFVMPTGHRLKHCFMSQHSRFGWCQTPITGLRHFSSIYCHNWLRHRSRKTASQRAGFRWCSKWMASVWNRQLKLVDQAFIS